MSGAFEPTNGQDVLGAPKGRAEDEFQPWLGTICSYASRRHMTKTLMTTMAQPRVAGNGPGVLGTHLAPKQHVLK